MQTKIYAAVFPLKGGEIYSDWSSCSSAVRGVKGVLYKKFSSEQEAHAWIANKTKGESNISTKIIAKEKENNNQTLADNVVEIYVDGSFIQKHSHAGWGWVALQKDEVLAEDCGLTPEPAKSRNIDGELYAAYQGIKWFSESTYEYAILYHDYQGIASWPLGDWKAKSEVALEYLELLSMLDEQRLEKVRFKKVKGHSGDRWNDYVDELAKASFKENDLTK